MTTRTVRTQGHVLRVEDLLSTLCVEAGDPVEVGWSDERYAQVATGRARPDQDEARLLGPVVDRLPLLC